MTYPTPQHTPAKRKYTAAWIVLGVLGGIAVICVGGVLVTGGILAGGKDTGTSTARTVGLNQAARDGKFEFTVTKVECGTTSVGTSNVGKTAQGQFCMVYVTVANIGNEAQTFFDSNQQAFNAAGQKYEADTEASLYLAGDSNAFLEDINPGNAVRGIVVFDIPKNANIVKLELHDSAFSGGVTVTVSSS